MKSKRKYSKSLLAVVMTLLTYVPVIAWGAGETITIDFEGAGETKTAYASGTVTLSGFDWDLTEALIGTTNDDWKDGERSLRMRGYGASALTLLDTLWGGVDSISFEYRRYSDDQQVDWRVEYTTDNGESWVQVGDDFTAPATNIVQTFSETINVSDAVRVRIARATTEGSANRRLNIDNIVLEVPAILPPPAPHVPVALPATAVQATQFVANWEPVTGNFASFELEVATSDQFRRGGETVVIDFEGDGETKTGYASGTVNLSGLDWNLTEALIGTGETDLWGEAGRSLRMRGYEASAMALEEDLMAGLSQISFGYRRYGTDAQVDWRVEYSLNQGDTWTQIGEDFTAPATNIVQTFSESVSVSQPVRVRIVRATMDGNTQNRRLNIDNIELLPFSTVDEVVEGYDPLITTETSVLVEGLDPEATHFYRVRTVGLDGVRSDWSDVVRVTARRPTLIIIQ